MKRIKTMIYFAIITIIAYSCTTRCSLPCTVQNTPVSVVTYLENSLNYPIIVQAYYIPFDNSVSWLLNEEKAFESPVEIPSGESKVIMDFVLPTRIEVRDSQTGQLLYETSQEPPFAELFPSYGNGLVRIEIPSDKYGFLSAAEVLSTLPEGERGDFQHVCFKKGDAYLSHNIDWGEYPIWYQYISVNAGLVNLENDRKASYESFADGHAVAHVLKTNSEAECFQHP